MNPWSVVLFIHVLAGAFLVGASIKPGAWGVAGALLLSTAAVVGGGAAAAVESRRRAPSTPPPRQST